MKGFRAKKVAPEPKRIRGWRTIKAGSSRVLLALLPGKKTKAIKVFTPIHKKRKASS